MTIYLGKRTGGDLASALLVALAAEKPPQTVVVYGDDEARDLALLPDDLRGRSQWRRGALLRRQPRIELQSACSALAEAGLGGGFGLRVGASERHVASRLLVSDAGPGQWRTLPRGKERRNPDPHDQRQGPRPRRRWAPPTVGLRPPSVPPYGTQPGSS